MRSQRKSVFTLPSQNMWLWGAMALSLVLTTAIIFIPALANIFGFAHITLAEYGVAMLLAVCVVPVVELVKFIQRKCTK